MLQPKYNSKTGKYQTISTAAIQSTENHDFNYVQVVYKVTDGSSLDSDGTANGSIKDPAGLAVNTGGLADTGQSEALPLFLGFGFIVISIIGIRIGTKTNQN